MKRSRHIFARSQNLSEKLPNDFVLISKKTNISGLLFNIKED